MALRICASVALSALLLVVAAACVAQGAEIRVYLYQAPEFECRVVLHDSKGEVAEFRGQLLGTEMSLKQGEPETVSCDNLGKSPVLRVEGTAKMQSSERTQFLSVYWYIHRSKLALLSSQWKSSHPFLSLSSPPTLHFRIQLDQAESGEGELPTLIPTIGGHRSVKFQLGGLTCFELRPLVFSPFTAFDIVLSDTPCQLVPHDMAVKIALQLARIFPIATDRAELQDNAVLPCQTDHKFVPLWIYYGLVPKSQHFDCLGPENKRIACSHWGATFGFEYSPYIGNTDYRGIVSQLHHHVDTKSAAKLEKSKGCLTKQLPERDQSAPLSGVLSKLLFPDDTANNEENCLLLSHLLPTFLDKSCFKWADLLISLRRAGKMLVRPTTEEPFGDSVIPVVNMSNLDNQLGMDNM